jgi:agmatine deiminase
VILDSHTNFLYLSDKLSSKKYLNFLNNFKKALIESNTAYDFLPGTKDIWAVDYMPIQIEINKFIRFSYYPDYLVKCKKWEKTITDTDFVCNSIKIKTEQPDPSIIIDGGNVIKGNSYVIMTSKIFKENSKFSEIDLLNKIEELFKTKIVIIPMEKCDWIGHADGIVRYYKDDTVLINDYSKEEGPYQVDLRMSLRNAGLKYIEIPYSPNYKSHVDAKGFYINFLEMNNKIFLPVFHIKDDERAVRQFEELYRGYKIIPIISNEIAKDGGVLNCISWNILK